MAASSSARAAGIWSAGAALVFSLAYIVAQLFDWAGLLGSGGGPNASSTSLGIALLLTPSLLLGPSFVVLCAVLPALALQMFLPWLIWLGALWAITFPLAMVLLARMFRSLP